MKEIIYALLSAIVWGTAPLIFKLGLKGEVPPLVGIFFHNLTATLISALSIFLLKEKLSYPARDIFIICFGGFISGYLGLLLYYKALKTGDVSVVAPISATSPMWASLFAILLFGESLTLPKVLGTIFVVIGIVLIMVSVKNG